MEGIYNINKPVGWTSNDVVRKVKNLTKRKKVGHAGTLDPLASGVLVVAVGKTYTKKLASLIQKEKEYEVVVKLGETSTTDDEEGEKKVYEVLKKPTRKEIEKIVGNYIGDIMQRPPIYSALKIKGQEAYKRARKGEQVEMKERPAKVFDITIRDYSYPFLTLYIKTGSGVYIRSIARDIGEDLKTGGYVSNLIRISVGRYILKVALTIEEFEILCKKKEQTLL